MTDIILKIYDTTISEHVNMHQDRIEHQTEHDIQSCIEYLEIFINNLIKKLFISYLPKKELIKIVTCQYT